MSESENPVEVSENSSVESSIEVTPSPEPAAVEKKPKAPKSKKVTPKPEKKEEPAPEPTPSPKKTAAKKSAPKKAAPKPEAKKSAPKKVESVRKRGGLRAGQIRILRLLAKKDLLNRKQIAEKAPVDVFNCVELIGSHDEQKRLANDEKHYPSLVSLGLVKPEIHDVEGRDKILYRITAKGKAEASKN